MRTTAAVPFRKHARRSCPRHYARDRAASTRGLPLHPTQRLLLGCSGQEHAWWTPELTAEGLSRASSARADRFSDDQGTRSDMALSEWTDEGDNSPDKEAVIVGESSAFGAEGWGAPPGSRR